MRILNLIAVAFFISCSHNNKEESVSEVSSDNPEISTEVKEASAGFNEKIEINPLNHATFVMRWDSLTIYNDPNGGASAFEGFDAPDIILISDIHGDHLNQKTLDSLDRSNAVLVMPQAVADQLPKEYSNGSIILSNGEEAEVKGIKIKAVPMYNLPETEDSRHPKGRGNGYILTKEEYDVYIAGDTEAIPEMRALKGIDIAFIPMNLPYTMDVEQAADGVLEFAPRVVVPYHYRGQGGLSDVNKFKRLVDEGKRDIHVWLMDGWYSKM